MNRLGKQIGAIVFGVTLLFSSMQQVWASEAGQTPAVVDTEGTVEETTEADENVEVSTDLESVKDSVVQVVVEYVAETGQTYILKSGSGFLISENVVLTDYNLLSLSGEEMATAEAYLSTELGKVVSFSEVEGAETITAQIGVVMYRDVVVSAEVNQYSSREMRLGILSLGDSLSRSTAVLGDSSSVQEGTELYTVGYKTVSVMNPGQETERLSQRDVKVNQGQSNGEVTEASLTYMSHSAKISAGSDGGPTVDENGFVVGMNLYGGFEDGSYRTLEINEIKQLLDSCEIPYQESGLSDISKEDITDARTQGSSADKSLLNDYILNYSLIEKENYTEESYQVLEKALQDAEETKADEDATQEEIDNAVEQLTVAKAGLVVKKDINYPFFITLGILIFVIIAGLVLYILKLKGIIFQKTEPEKLVTLEEMPIQSKSGSLRPEPEIVMPKPRTSGRLGKGGESGGYKETTVLGVKMPAQSEGTVVLGTQAAPVEAYLVRQSKPDKVRIEGSEFLIGKDKSKVNYCVLDNPSISRCHAKILVREGKFYLSDMKSTNFTYLNGRILEYGEEAELKDGDSVRFSNEDFVFHIGNGEA